MRNQVILSVAAASLTWLAGTGAQAQTYSNTLMTLPTPPVAYWPLTETVAPASGLYIAANSGTLGAAGQGYYETWYQPFGSSPTMLPTNVIQHAPGVTKDGDTGLTNMIVGQHVVIPRSTNGVANPAVTLNPPFSIEVWVYPTNGANSGGIKPLVSEGFVNVLNGPSLGNQAVPQGVTIGSYNNIIYFSTFNGSGTKTEIDTAAYAANTWHHIVGTFDGTTMRLYDNGAPRGPATPPKDPLGRTYAPDLVTPLLIGCGGNQNNPFGGTIDEVAIYTNVLTAQQVTNHYFAQTTNSPASYYRTTVQGDNPTIYLRLDDTFAGAPDLSTCPVANNYGTLGSAANGRYQPGATLGIAGPPYSGFGASSYAVALDGFNAGVDVPLGGLPSQLNPTGNQPLTVVTWFRANPADCVGRFQEILGHSDLGWRMGLDYNAGNRFNPGAGPELLYSSVAEEMAKGMFLNDGNWHFAAGVSDGTNDYLYLDGILAKSGGSVASIIGTNLDIILGGDPQYTAPANGPGGSRYFDGNLAHVAFFTNALTAAQIQSLYSAAGVPPQVRVQPLSQGAFAGQTVTLSPSISGSTPMTYQWYKNGSPLSTQTGATLTFNPIATGDAAAYYLAITNANGWATSAVAQITVDAATSAYASAVQNLNPAGYWPLDETTQPPFGYYVATNLGTAGAAANGYYQTWYAPVASGISTIYAISNSIARATGPIAGDAADKALQCNYSTGAGQYIVFPRTTNGVANQALTIQAPFSIEVWVKPNSIAHGLTPIVNQGRNAVQCDANYGYNNAMAGFSLGQYNNFVYLQLYPTNANANGGPEPHVNGLTAGVWYHIVATFDGTTETLYSNGVQVATATATANGAGLRYVPDPVSPLLIGTGPQISGGGGVEYDGAIDEVAIYPTALTQPQAANHYAAAATASYASTVLGDNPTIYVRMNEPAMASPPTQNAFPVANNYGSLGAPANGLYQPGTTPGVAGPPFAGFGGTSRAVAFNGFFGSVDVGGGYVPLALNPTGNSRLSVAAWFRGNPADAPGRFQTIVGHTDSSWRLCMDGAGGNNVTMPAGLRFNPGNGPELQFANTADVVTNGFRVNDGNWHFVAGVSDGANDYLYIDGLLAKQGTGVGSVSGSTLDLMIGGDPQYTVPNYNTPRIRTFDGQVAQVAFFTNALSQAQIQQIYGAAGVPLTIVSQPVSVQVNSGTTAPLMTFGVRGSAPVYQWYSTNTTTGVVTPVANQTNASLAFNPATLSNSGFYFAIATNAYSSVTSVVAQLTVVGPPVVVQQSPTNVLVFAGTTPTLHAAAMGPSLTYQWTSNGVVIASATSPDYTLTTSVTSILGTNTYGCTITNSYGSTAVANISVGILADPTAPYPSAVLADKPVAYFRLNEAGNGGYDPNNGVTAYDYAGANNGSYTNTVLGQAGLGYAPQSDPNETAAEFGDWPPGNNYAGNVLTNLNFGVANGGNARFSVEAWVNKYAYLGSGNAIVALGTGNGGEQFVLDTGNQTAGYLRFFVRNAAGAVSTAACTNSLIDGLWHHVVGVCDEAGGHVYLYQDGALVGTGNITPGSGLLLSTMPLSIGARQSDNPTPANYDFQFIGLVDDVALYNTALSAAQVQAHYFASGIAPTITQIQPTYQDINQNGSASITVTAIGTTNLSYQWFDPANNPISGATTATLTLTNLQPSQTGDYKVTVSNAYGSANTNAHINVNQGPPVITVDLQPTNLVVWAGTPVSYYVTCSGSPPFSYQWYLNGSPITGATKATNAFTALAGTNTYRCGVTNAYSGGTPTYSAVGTVVGMPVTTLNPANYTDHLKITFTGYNRSETLKDFPVLVRLSSSLTGFNYAHFASPTGGDLRFTDASGTRVIPHEIDEWNPAGESTVWVQLPTLSGGGDSIWAYWGNPAATIPPPGTNVWVPQAWEGLPGFEIVYHLKESGFPYADSTLQYPALTGNAPTPATGIVGSGQTFANSYLDAGLVSLTDQMTLSAWVNLGLSDYSIQTVWANQPGGYGSPGFALFVNYYNTANKDLRLATGNGLPRPPDYNGAEVATPNNSVSYGQWHLLTAAINRTNGAPYGTVEMYVDGADLGRYNVVTNFNLLADLNLGRFTNNNFFFTGLMDEARIHSSAESSNWVWASYMTVAQNASLQSYSSVTSTVPVLPVVLSNMTYEVSGTNLVLSGSGGAGAIGKSYQVLATTNVALPMASWNPVSTNLFDSSGNFIVTNALDPAKPQEFFRVVAPQ